jgi:hypothetical protein
MAAELLAKSPVEPVNQTSTGIAIKGYDPVSYFVDSRSEKGSAQFTFRWMNAQWQFVSAANRDRFAAEPENYAPQFGGYCAWAVSKGYTADIDPNAWTIAGGKLYLNYNKSVQNMWLKERDTRIQAAEMNWPGLHK